MKRFCVVISDGRYIKRTSHFGHFHGSIVLTNDPEERRWWTREADAKSAANVFNYRLANYKWDAEKFGKLTAIASAI